MKKFLFVQDKPPHRTIIGQEGLDVILMGSAFTECTVLLLEDGIYQVLSDQKTEKLGTKDYSVSYKALKDYGVQNIYCCQSHLDHRDLSVNDLTVPVHPVSEAEVRDLFDAHDVILSF